MDEEIVIKVNHVYKSFRLPHEKATTLKSLFTGLLNGSGGRSVETQHALKDISFEIQKGEFFGIVGRNGSGKSTLLKILAGIYQANKGSVSVQGKLVPFIELGVGFNPELTGRENVYLNGALLGFNREEVSVMYDEIVDFAELSKFMDQKLKNYSSGMQVRLAFSMAIRARADILLVDEVLAVGDVDFQRKCFEYFKKLKKDKKTVVFVSHDMDSVREYCDRAVLIEDSVVLAEGPSAKIAAMYKKMFIEEYEATDNTEEDNLRWGSGEVKFLGVDVKPNKVVSQNSSITISAKLKANKAVPDVVFGFSIKEPSGQLLFGTNSRIKGQATEKLVKDDVRIIEWKIPHIFNDGKYQVNVALVDETGTRTYDWWDEAASFIVLSEENPPYPLNPPVELNIIKPKT